MVYFQIWYIVAIVLFCLVGLYFMILHIEDNEPSISFAEGIGGCVFWPIVGFLLANKGLFSIRKRLFERKTHG